MGPQFQAFPDSTKIGATAIIIANGCNIISDRDKIFMSKFWKALCKLTGVKLKMFSAYHPETDGSSERSNKTVVQALRYHVE